jgi:hypothetical protein
MTQLDFLSLTSVVEVALLGLVVVVLLQSIRFIPNTRVGILEKRFSPRGSVRRS